MKDKLLWSVTSGEHNYLIMWQNVKIDQLIIMTQLYITYPVYLQACDSEFCNPFDHVGIILYFN